MARARKIQRFLSQPFAVAEVFTGTPGARRTRLGFPLGCSCWPFFGNVWPAPALLMQGNGGLFMLPTCCNQHSALALACVIYTAQRLLDPFLQPFLTARHHSSLPGTNLNAWHFCSAGKYVELKDTINDFKGVLEGKYDDLPEMAFYMVSPAHIVLSLFSQLLPCSRGLPALFCTSAY